LVLDHAQVTEKRLKFKELMESA